MAAVLRVRVHIRLPSKSSQLQIPVANFDEDAGTVIASISKEISKPESEFDVLYAGKVLKPGTKLSSYFLQDNSTLYIARKFTNPTPAPEVKHDEVTARADIVRAVQSALLVQDYRSLVEKLLLDSESIENVIATTPGLDNDPAILLMLQDPELLAILAHPSNFNSLLKNHPSFARAAVTIAALVREETAKLGLRATLPGSAIYSLDQMSDDDDDMPTQASRSRMPAGMHNITASQLASALQAAAGTSGQASSSSDSSSSHAFQSAPGASSSGSTITSDFFQQAMAHAQSASSDGALQQLRDMGITDDNVARQALAATNGDIQAALDLIFGDGFM